eukprot:6210186-Pleurochrysis_carterae.AAC.1
MRHTGHSAAAPAARCKPNYSYRHIATGWICPVPHRAAAPSRAGADELRRRTRRRPENEISSGPSSICRRASKC